MCEVRTVQRNACARCKTSRLTCIFFVNPSPGRSGRARIWDCREVTVTKAAHNGGALNVGEVFRRKKREISVAAHCRVYNVRVPCVIDRAFCTRSINISVRTCKRYYTVGEMIFFTHTARGSSFPPRSTCRRRRKE